MQDLAAHILDIAENSFRAGARLVRIDIQEDPGRDLLHLRVEDDGRGMEPEQAGRALDPFVTSRTTRRVGLGLPLLSDSAREADGDVQIESRPGLGTRVEASMRLRHIDRKPLGDLTGCVLNLLLMSGDADFVFRRARDEQIMTFDSRELRRQLDEVPLTHPDVLNFVREYLSSAFAVFEPPRVGPGKDH